jgi:hypothetical protein
VANRGVYFVARSPWSEAKRQLIRAFRAVGPYSKVGVESLCRLSSNSSKQFPSSAAVHRRPETLATMSANRIDFPPQPIPTAPPPEPETLQSLTDRWSVHIPRRLLILPPTALVLGALIGVSRGGSRARLRFLAENAHRQPTTIQGWVSLGLFASRVSD